MTTKKKKVKKAPHLSVGATAEEIKIWREAAAKDRRTLSSWVRVVLNSVALRGGK